MASRRWLCSVCLARPKYRSIRTLEAPKPSGILQVWRSRIRCRGSRDPSAKTSRWETISSPIAGCSRLRARRHAMGLAPRSTHARVEAATLRMDAADRPSETSPFSPSSCGSACLAQARMAGLSQTRTMVVSFSLSASRVCPVRVGRSLRGRPVNSPIRMARAPL